MAYAQWLRCSDGKMSETTQKMTTSEKLGPHVGSENEISPYSVPSVYRLYIYAPRRPQKQDSNSCCDVYH